MFIKVNNARNYSYPIDVISEKVYNHITNKQYKNKNLSSLRFESFTFNLNAQCTCFFFIFNADLPNTSSCENNYTCNMLLKLKASTIIIEVCNTRIILIYDIIIEVCNTRIILIYDKHFYTHSLKYCKTN